MFGISPVLPVENVSIVRLVGTQARFLTSSAISSCDKCSRKLQRPNRISIVALGRCVYIGHSSVPAAGPSVWVRRGRKAESLGRRSLLSVASGEPGLHVRVAEQPEEQLRAAELLLSDRALGQEVASLLSGLSRIDGLVLATLDGRPVGACWVVATGGPAALFVPPVVDKGAPAGTALRLWEAARAWAKETGCRRLQAFVMEASRGAIGDFLRSAGFREGPAMHYLVAEADGSSEPQLPSGYTWRPYAASDEAIWHKVLEATYADSLDCADLEEEPSVHESLHQYRAAGDSRDRWWWLLRWQDREIGCLILADHRAYDQMELVYVGVVPEFRGQGLGQIAAQRSRSIAGQLGRKRVVLAVDARNTPALTMYDRAGFVRSETRRLYLYEVRSASTSDASASTLLDHPELRRKERA